MLDTTHPIETPEGVSLELKPAGPTPRAAAWVIDLLIRATGVGVIYFVLILFLGNLGGGLALILFFLTEWFYSVFFEVKAGGQTPGKKIMKLTVVNQDGTPIGWGASILRNLLRTVDALPLVALDQNGPGIYPVYGLGLLVCLLNKRFQRLGDMAAGTLVIYAEETYARGVNFPNADPSPPPQTLTLQEQKALITFGERSERLNQARTAELADVLTPLTGKKGWEGAQKLFDIAAWFMGGRK